MNEAIRISEKTSATNRQIAERIDKRLKELANAGILPHKLPNTDGKDFYAPYGDASQLDHRRRVFAQRSLLAELNKVAGAETKKPTRPFMAFPVENDYKSIELATRLTELIEYDKTVMTLFDLNNPIERERLDEIYPEFTQKRLEFIYMVAEMQRTYARLIADGIRTEDDLEFIICLFLLNDYGLSVALLMQTPVHLLIYKNPYLSTGRVAARDGGEDIPQLFENRMPYKLTDRIEKRLIPMVKNMDQQKIFLMGILGSTYDSTNATRVDKIIESVKDNIPDFVHLPRLAKLLSKDDLRRYPHDIPGESEFVLGDKTSPMLKETAQRFVNPINVFSQQFSKMN